MAAATLNEFEFPWWTPPDVAADGDRVVPVVGPNGTTLVLIAPDWPLMEATLQVVGAEPFPIAGLRGTVATLTFPGFYTHQVLLAEVKRKVTPVVADGVVAQLSTLTVSWFEIEATGP